MGNSALRSDKWCTSHLKIIYPLCGCSSPAKLGVGQGRIGLAKMCHVPFWTLSSAQGCKFWLEGIFLMSQWGRCSHLWGVVHKKTRNILGCERWYNERKSVTKMEKRFWNSLKNSLFGKKKMFMIRSLTAPSVHHTRWVQSRGMECTSSQVGNGTKGGLCSLQPTWPPWWLP